MARFWALNTYTLDLALKDAKVNRIHKLRPSIVRKIWGGERLEKLRHLKNEKGESDPVGETWEISCHKDGPSFNENDESLEKLYSERDLPYLVKLIDTSDYLSVQVHPDDAFAKEHENSLGKTECWLILDAEEGAGIYLGMKPEVSKTDFEEALKDGQPMDQYLIFRPVKRGDFFFVPAGSIHAIGKGVFLAEIQQSSGITYRVWDWNRVDANGKGRELHIEKAMQVINFDDVFNSDENFQVKFDQLNNATESSLVRHPFFHADIYQNESLLTLETGKEGRLDSIMVLEGSIEISCGEEMVRLNSLESCLIEKGQEVKIKEKGDSSFIHIY